MYGFTSSGPAVDPPYLDQLTGCIPPLLPCRLHTRDPWLLLIVLLPLLVFFCSGLAVQVDPGCPTLGIGIFHMSWPFFIQLLDPPFVGFYSQIMLLLIVPTFINFYDSCVPQWMSKKIKFCTDRKIFLDFYCGEQVLPFEILALCTACSQN